MSRLDKPPALQKVLQSMECSNFPPFIGNLWPALDTGPDPLNLLSSDSKHCVQDDTY
jgi:hypothetical protein